LIAEQKGIKIRLTDHLDEYNMVVIDQESYIKILSNLLTNALKYTRDEIIVELVRKEEDNCFTLIVTDNGIGIKEDDMKGIFTLFNHYQDHRFPLKSYGIGLSTVNMLANKMGAVIHVKSECEKFASFSIVFPYGDIDQAVLAESEAEWLEQNTPPLTLTHEESILLVDDNEDMLSFMTRLFSNYYNVFKASEGSEALNILNANTIDLIVCDVIMPGVDGLALADQVRNNIKMSHIPIVMLTAKVGVEAKITGLLSGADVYLEKPVSIDYLLAQVKSLLEKRRKVKETLQKLPFIPLSSVSNNKIDNEFVQAIEDIIKKNISNQQFGVNDIADAIHMSRSVLYAKLQAISDVTPNDFIRLIRLRRAAEYLAEGKYRINEICYLVGFNSPSYFTKCFQNQFGILPKEFTNNYKKN
jgi:DNA-binding response OmpR family regulator